MSVTTYITRGIHSSTTIKDYITRGLSIGDSSIISDADASKIASYVWEHVLEASLEAQEFMRIMLSTTAAGLVSGLPGEPQFLAQDGKKVRVRMITDENGNRLKVLVLDGS